MRLKIGAGDGPAAVAVGVRRVDDHDDRDRRLPRRQRSRRTRRCSRSPSSGRRSASTRCRSCRRRCSRRSARPSRCRPSTTASMIVVSVAAVAGSTARRIAFGLTAYRRLSRYTARTMRGSMSSPPLAIALDRRDHLQRRHADLVAHRHRGERALGPLVGAPDDAGALAGKVRRDRPAESEPIDVAAQALGAEPEANLRPRRRCST